MIAGPTSTSLLVTEWLLLSVVFILILARLYLRLKIKRQRLNPSDWFLILAFLSAASALSFDIIFLRMGILRPDVDVYLTSVDDPAILQTAFRYFWISNFPLFTTFYLCKASILAFYLQLFPPHVQAHRVLIYIVIAYSAAGFIVSVCLILFLCYPINRNWSLGPDACSLADIFTTFRVPWAFHFSSDILIFALPFLILHKLQMRRLAKIGVYCTFGLGIINLAFCLTRFLMVELQGSWGAAPLTLIDLWCSLDFLVGLIITSLPSLRPYLRIIHDSPYVSSLRNRKSDRTNRDNSGANTATNGFNRIEDVPEEGHINMHKDVSVRSGGSRGGSAWYEAKTYSHEAQPTSCDEEGSDIELAPIRSSEQ